MVSGRAKNEKNYGVTGLEPVGRDKNSGFQGAGSVRTKETQRKHIDTVIKREVTSASSQELELLFC